MNWLKELHYKFMVWQLAHRLLNKGSWKIFKKLQNDRYIRKLINE